MTSLLPQKLTVTFILLLTLIFSGCKVAPLSAPDDPPALAGDGGTSGGGDDDDDDPPQETPTDLKLEDITQIASGSAFTCALGSNTRVYCWGSDSDGQLGRDSGVPVYDAVARPVRIDLSTYLEGAISITAGRAHACAVLNTGTIRCWGDNQYGQIGDGTTTDKEYATLVEASAGVLLGGAKVVSAGYWHTCAIIGSNDSAICWGSHAHDQLGNPNLTTDHSVYPTTVVGVVNNTFLTGIKDIQAGRLHSCARMSDDRLTCWGNNLYGQVGNNTFTAQNRPKYVKYLDGQNALDFANVDQFESSVSHGCGVFDEKVRCWGSNGSNQLGNIDFNTTSQMSSAVPVWTNNSGDWLNPISKVTTGADHSCAIKSGGVVRCWGSNQYFQIGNNDDSFANTYRSTTPRWGALNQTPLYGVQDISAGDHHTCAITRISAPDGDKDRAVCWGNNTSGQSGSDSSHGDITPTRNNPAYVAMTLGS